MSFNSDRFTYTNKEQTMTRRFAIATLMMFTLTLAAAAPLAAHPGHEHKMMGTVTMAAPDHLMMKTTDGKDATVKITADTKIVKGKEPAKVDDLKAGTRVVVTALAEDKAMIAQKIEIGATTTK